jgi:TetR/AcrR family transcriptional regulator, repressor for uid operon
MRKIDPVKHGEKRQEILEAAGRCFARKGFQGATISDICAEADISPGHLYHYFASKEEIIAGMAEARLAFAAECFSRVVEGPDPIAALVAGIELGKARFDPKGQGQSLLLEIMAEAGRNPAVAKILQEHSKAVRALLADVLRKGQARGLVDESLDADLAAAVLLSVIAGSKTLTIHDPKLDMKKSAGLLQLLITRFLTPPAKLRAQLGQMPKVQTRASGKPNRCA